MKGLLWAGFTNSILELKFISNKRVQRKRNTGTSLLRAPWQGGFGCKAYVPRSGPEDAKMGCVTVMSGDSPGSDSPPSNGP